MSKCNKEIIDLLADGFKSDQTIVGLSDIYAHLLKSFEKPYSSKVYLPADIEHLVNNQHKPYNHSGLQNWLEFYKPYQGSDKFINFLLKLLKVKSDIIPWYESDNPTNTFDLTLDEFPDGLELDKFIDLINTYKNIESKLASMRTSFCPVRFTLDSSKLDYDILSDTSGIDINGTTFCFGHINRQSPIIVDDIITSIFLTNHNSYQFLYGNYIYLDYWILGEKLDGAIVTNNRISRKIFDPVKITEMAEWVEPTGQLWLNPHRLYYLDLDLDLDLDLKVNKRTSKRVWHIPYDAELAVRSSLTASRTDAGRLRSTWAVGSWDKMMSWNDYYEPYTQNNHIRVS